MRTKTGADGHSAAFHTDQYELGNLQGALYSGVAGRRAVFEVFARRLPPGRRYGVFCGLGRILDAIGRFRFTDAQVAWLEAGGAADEPTRRFLGVEAARAHRASARRRLPPEQLRIQAGPPALEARIWSRRTEEVARR